MPGPRRRRGVHAEVGLGFYLRERLRERPGWAGDPKPAYCELRDLYLDAHGRRAGKREQHLRSSLFGPNVFVRRRPCQVQSYAPGNVCRPKRGVVQDSEFQFRIPVEIPRPLR